MMIHQVTHRYACVYITILLLTLSTGCVREQTQESPAPSSNPTGVQLTEVWTLAEGLDRPESVVYDAAHDALYLSNIVGEGDAKDGNGYIARISPEGRLLDRQWVPGLNAPKGLTLSNGRLFAADLDALVEIDPSDGQVVNRYTVSGDVYLNDVTAGPDGTVYVSDSRYSKIYRLHDGQFDVWMDASPIRMPNGVHVVGDELFIAAGDSTDEHPGRARYLQAVSLQDQTVRPLKDRTPEGALDAVEPDGQGGLFVTDWGSGRLMHFTAEGGLVLLQQLGQGAADAEYVAEQRMLYVPVMQEHQLIAYRVN